MGWKSQGWIVARSLTVALACFATGTAPAQSLLPEYSGAHAHLDARSAPAKATDPRTDDSRHPDVVAATAALAARIPGLEVRRSALTNAPELVHSLHGPLTAAAPDRSSESIVRDFLSENRAVYALDAADLDTLVVLGDSPGGRSGLRMVRLEQRVGGLPVFSSETRFVLDRTRRLWRSMGTLVPGAAASAPAIDRAHLLPAADALVGLFAVDAVKLDGAAVVARNPDAELVELLAPAPVAGSAWARLVLFPLAPGLLVPAWSLTVFTSGESDWYGVVDAQTGAVLWRRNLREYASLQQARFSVYVAADGKTPADSPAPQSPSAAVPGAGTQYPEIARTTVQMSAVQDLAASPNGWIDDCPGGADGCDTTSGNNVDACLDRDGNANVCDAAALDVSGRPRGNPDAAARNRDFLGAAPRDFVYAPAPVGGNPDAGDAPTNPDYQRGAAVHLFYLVNWYHDRLFGLGFDEPSGNFQQQNFQGLGGLGGDRIAADVQNTGNNAGNFTPAADGVQSRMQIPIYDGPSPDRDAGLDTSIVLHELTHGLTHRLVGNSTGLLWDVARSMGEGWSDFYALALVNTTNADDPNAHYGGSWITYKLAALTDNYVYGYRRFPYTTDNAVNPLTWADVDPVTADDSGGIPPNPSNYSRFGALEAHNGGTVWAVTLWEVRARIIADAAGANGDVPSGNETMLQLVTDALKMTPSNPSFVDGRDALFAADCATNACANERSIWDGFADRGLGYKAVAPIAVAGRFATSHIGVGTSFSTPYLDVIDPTVDVTIVDTPLGNGNGRLDPGETVTLTVRLSNPWRAASSVATGVTATLTTSTAGASVGDGTAAYPSIAPLGNAANNADPFQITLGDSILCGSTVQFDLTTASSLGNRTAHFALRVGMPGAAGPAVTYTATPNLPIPDNDIDGVSSPLPVGDDLEIADLNFRVDSLTHAVSGQLSVMLRAPNGLGVDLIWKRGGLLVPNQGVAADFTNVVIDDDLPLTAEQDLNQSSAAQAPFTGDWLPAFNSPFWDTYVTSPAVARDPVGVLGRLDGTSTQGTWTVNVADGNNSVTGTLNGWSLIATPRVYACTPFAPTILFADGFE